jgi:hypothetical protein
MRRIIAGLAAAVGLWVQAAAAESALSPAETTVHSSGAMAAQDQPANLQGTSGFAAAGAKERSTLTYSAGGTSLALLPDGSDMTFTSGAQRHDILMQK